MNKLFDKYDRFIIDKPIRLIELFAGYGSQAMGLKRLQNEGLCEFEHYRCVEFDANAVKSYNAVHGTSFDPIDITTIHGSDLGIVDKDRYIYMLTYTYPCQNISLAGHKAGMAKGSGTNSSLLWEVERLLNEVDNLPQLLVMENVTQVHLGNNKYDFIDWLAYLKSRGYSNYYQDLQPYDYGIPQQRDRCIMVSILGDYDYFFPKSIPLTKTMKSLLEPNDDIPEKYYIKYKMFDYVTKHGTNTSTFYDNMTNNSIAKPSVDNYGYDSLSLNAGLKDARIRKIWGIYGNSQGGSVFDENGISPTITANVMNWHICLSPDRIRIRILTPRECGRLMGVSDEDITKILSAHDRDSICYKQFGNSVVVNIWYYVFKQFLIK